MGDDMMRGRTYEGNPANFIEMTGPCKEYVCFSSNGEIRTLTRAEWNLLPDWNLLSLPDPTHANLEHGSP